MYGSYEKLGGGGSGVVEVGPHEGEGATAAGGFRQSLSEIGYIAAMGTSCPIAFGLIAIGGSTTDMAMFCKRARP